MLLLYINNSIIIGFEVPYNVFPWGVASNFWFAFDSCMLQFLVLTLMVFSLKTKNIFLYQLVIWYLNYLFYFSEVQENSKRHTVVPMLKLTGKGDKQLKKVTHRIR